MKAKQFFTHAAAFHARIAKAASECADECSDRGEDHHAAFYRAVAGAHTEMGEHAVEMCKAEGGDDERDFSKLQPTKVSGIASPAPRAIPRFGQRDISAGIDTTPNHPSVFEKIYSSAHEEE